MKMQNEINRFKKFLSPGISWALLWIFIPGLLFSCVDTEAKIEIGKKGDGTINIVYSVDSGFLETGALEANIPSPPLPLSRQDIERQMAGIPGVSLLSWARKDGKKNSNFAMKFRFASPEALALFLDPRGSRARFSGNPSGGELVLQLAEGPASRDQDILALMKEAGHNRAFKITVILPVKPQESVLTGTGGAVTSKDSQTTFNSTLESIAATEGPLVWKIRW